MSDFSHLKSKLLAEQVEDQIYRILKYTPIRQAQAPLGCFLGERFRVGRSISGAVSYLSSKGIVEVPAEIPAPSDTMKTFDR